MTITPSSILAHTSQPTLTYNIYNTYNTYNIHNLHTAYNISTSTTPLDGQSPISNYQ
jgi:hypothetical protein